jgi:hypothetical protein
MACPAHPVSVKSAARRAAEAGIARHLSHPGTRKAAHEHLNDIYTDRPTPEADDWAKQFDPTGIVSGEVENRAREKNIEEATGQEP